MNTRRALAFLVAAVVSKSMVFGMGSGGIANEVTSAEGLSELLGVTGSKTDPAVVYNNPASIADIGQFISSLGLMYYNFSAERKASNGVTDKMETGNIVVPNFAMAGHLGEGKFGLGLAILSPYGLETEWSATSGVRYVATKSSLKMVDITPGVSYRPSEKVAVGVGVDYFLTFDASLEKKVNVDVLNLGLCVANPLLCGGLTNGAPDANSKLSGDGDQWGYHAGLLYNPAPSHTLGLTYHSEVKTRIEGDVELTGLSGGSTLVFGSDFKTPGHTDLFYPQNVQFGYKYSKDDKWAAGFNVAWYDWSSNQELAVNVPSANAAQQSILAVPIPLKWRDVWSGTIGGFYRFSDKWKLNAGVYYLPHVYPEETYTPAVPDMEKIGISVGPSYTAGAWTIDTVYNPLFYKTTTINNNLGLNTAGFAGADISGEYEAMVHIVGVNVKYRFK